MNHSYFEWIVVDSAVAISIATFKRYQWELVDQHRVYPNGLG
ncbi:hypothetical protein PC129_g12756 [Phytophthora cactorum]|uniref:Uncharacterized protein n=1 Tax=Phytophthora cactorum TaxID=29920 RepID=A0A8T1CDX2_9STRA|nr:hypothetical protein Pcac1_g15925 [Phytophthora cactorum]KAG2814028.1 hypothetical protein PC112_g14477 [Phytophthora cactorum]KAG2851726.1 hypothetical protein PC113_g15658 [Phytophthora cactorum]KAG2894737.1 hypothetical protein PC114_g15785 [Phytophthora cactorum]KAG2907613.1 hypothetical protein PC115_g13862 [Phytophthora cactorum]